MQVSEVIASSLRDLISRFPSFPSAEVEGRVAGAMYTALGRRTNDGAEIAVWRPTRPHRGYHRRRPRPFSDDSINRRDYSQVGN